MEIETIRKFKEFLIESGMGVLKKKTAKDLAVMFLESLSLKVFTFLLVIYTARTLGPQEFGIYSLITVSILFLNEFLDLGFSNTAIRYSMRFPVKREPIFGLYFVFRGVSLLGVLLCIFLFPGVISRLFRASAVLKYSLIILSGATIDSLLMVVSTYWQSLEKFTYRAILNSSVNLIRLVSVFWALRLKVVNLELLAALFALSGLPLLLVSARFLIKFLKKLVCYGIPKRLFLEMLHYEKWIVMGAVPMIIMARLDFFIVTTFLSFKEAGLYNSAVALSGVLTIILFAARNVYFPKVSKYKDLRNIDNYISKINTLVVFVTIFSVLLLPFSRYIIFFFLGDKYLPATAVLQILFLSFLFTFWNVMLSIVFYALGSSRLMAIGAYIQLAIFTICSFVFVPQTGMVGAALSKCISDGVYLLFVMYYLPKVKAASFPVNG